MRSLRLLRAPAAALLLAAALTGPVSADWPMLIPLAPPGPPGVSGHATVTSAGPDRAVVTVEMNGLTAGPSYVVHLHAGTCANPSASFGVLGTLVPDATGKATLTASSALISATGAATDLTLGGVADGEHVLALKISGILACSAIPKMTAFPAQLPTAGDPTVVQTAALAGSVGVFGLAAGAFLRRR